MPVITGSLAALGLGKLVLAGAGAKVGLASAAATAGSTFAAMGPAGPQLVGGLASAIPALLASKSPVRHYIVHKVFYFTHTILGLILYLTSYIISYIEFSILLGRLHMMNTGTREDMNNRNIREDMKNRNITSQHPHHELDVVEQAEDVGVDGDAEADANRNIKSSH